MIVHFKPNCNTAYTLAILILTILTILAVSGSIQHVDESGQAIVLNPKSYPQVGGHWTVDLDLSSGGNLVVTAVDGTYFGDDIGFARMYGQDNADAQPSYQDDGTVRFDDIAAGSWHFEVVVYTAGRHDMIFKLGDSTAHASNNALIPGAFVTTWKTTSANEEITIPIRPSSSGNYIVTWGDGNATTHTGHATHTYVGAGNHTISVSGNNLAMHLSDDPSNAAKLVSIDQWGDVQWKSMTRAFYGASNMIYNAVDVPNLSDVRDMSYMFASAPLFDGDLSEWDVSDVRNMSYMFWEAQSFNGNISTWDVSRVTNTRNMFQGTTIFNGNLSAWDVSRVTDMGGMFHRTPVFNSDISGWDVSNVKSMGYLFKNAYDFNSDISDWDVSRVTNMERLFSFAYDFNSDISAWDVSHVTNMQGTFNHADSFTGDISDWDVSRVTNMSYMFWENQAFNGNISDWDVSRVTDMSWMFDRTHVFNGNISDWDVSRVTNMDAMFRGATAFDNDLSGWDISSVTNMKSMFLNAPVFNSNISNWDVSNVESMNQMFKGAQNFNSDISDWDVSSVTDMEGMFNEAFKFKQNLGDWYVVLNNTAVNIDDVPGVIGTISAQNLYLGGQNVTYGIGTDGNSTLFEIADDTGLSMTVSPTNSAYTVNITSTGSFGTTNHRVYTITVPAGPTNPVPVTSITSGDEVNGKTYDNLQSPYFITTVKIGSGTYALVTASSGGSGVQIIDITDPANPVPESSFDDDDTVTVDDVSMTFDKLYGSQGIATTTIGSSTYAIVAAFKEHGVQIIDITNPASPVPVASFGDGDTVTVNGVNKTFDKLEGAFGIAMATIGSSTYALVSTYTDDGVQIVNITNPASPVPVASFGDGDTVTVNGINKTFDKLDGGEGIATVTIGTGTYALVTGYYSNGVQIIDITDPANPVPAASFGDGGRVSGVSKTFNELRGANGITTVTIGTGTYALVTAFDDDGVQIIDITDPANPVPAASFGDGDTIGGKTFDKLDGAFGIDTVTIGTGTYALVAAVFDSGIQIIDITDPANPVPAASVGNGDSFDGKTFDKLTVPRGITAATIGSNAYALVAAFLVDSVQIIDLGETPDITAPPPDDSFSTTWQTTSADETITIPVNNAMGLYTVYWGDGNVTTYDGDATHTYDSAGSYTVSISGNFTHIYLAGDSDNAKKLESINQWGNMRWESMHGAFYGASNMIYNATDEPNLADVTDMSGMFNGASSFDGDISSWDVSDVTDMSGMFNGASSFDGDISSWDVFGVNGMSGMFSDSTFNQDISDWDVSHVTDMDGMFSDSTFNQDISDWNVSGVVDMSYMFSDSTFNQDISDWNVSSVTYMENMFSDSTFNQDISDWNVSGVVDMSYMFSDSTFNQDISDWNVSSVTYMENMFSDSTFNQDISDWNVSGVVYMSYMFSDSTFNQDISDWNVSSVTYMENMFSDSTFNQDISDWNVSGVVYMDDMFNTASVFKQNLGKWYVVLDSIVINAEDAPGIVGTISTQSQALDYPAPTYGIGTGGDRDSFKITGGSDLNMAVSPDKPNYIVNITSTGSFGTSNHRIYNITVLPSSSANLQFSDDSFVTTWQTTSADETITIPVGSAPGNYTVYWGDGSVTMHIGDAIHTYTSAGNHTISITGGFTLINLAGDMDNAAKIISIDQWGDVQWESMQGAFRGALNMRYNATDVPDLSRVWDTSSMFRDAAAFDGDLSGWDVSNMTYMYGMFYDATVFDSDLSGWDVADVTNMGSMFRGTALFNSDLSGWNVSGVNNMYSMFRGATAFDSDLSGWNVSEVTDMHSMFRGATAFDSDLSGWDISSVTTLGSMFKDASTFMQNLGNWYIVLDSTEIHDEDAPGIVGTISTQSQALDYPVPTYGIGTGGDRDSFKITGGSDLNMAVSPDKPNYIVNITSTGSFGTSNHRIYNITVIPSVNFPFSDDPFVTTWKTTYADETIAIPVGNATGNYTVHWGDGNATTHIGDAIHTYASAGNHTISITGDFTRINLAGNFTNAKKLVSIDQWGGIRWESMNGAFFGASNMAYNATDVPNLSKVTDTSFMFGSASSFNDNLSDWNVSRVTDMTGMFSQASSFDGDISTWDVSDVTDMTAMFNLASSFNGNLSGWDASNAKSLDGMFSGARDFDGDLSGWDVSGAKSMRSMFSSARDFDGDLSVWNVSGVTDMTDMFSNTSNFNGDLSGWDVSGAKSLDGMFSGTRAFNGDLSGWDVSGAKSMRSMFSGTWDFDGDISTWNVSGVTDMTNMFNNASVFDGDLSRWDVSSAIYMDGMFLNAIAFNGDLSGWNVSGVKSMNGMFLNALVFDGDLSGWNVSDVIYMDRMFKGAINFNQDLSTWDISSVTHMDDMFNDASAFKQNLGNWYVVLNSTGIHVDDAPGIVGGISAQNLALDRQNPTYGIGDWEDFDSFEIVGDSILNMTVSPDKSHYTVNVTSTGDFGTFNYRIYNVTVTGIDTIVPTVMSIERYSPVTESTDSQTLVYKVTFSEAVTGVTQSDFVLSSDSTGTAANSVTSISGSGSQYFVTVSASSDGTYNLDLVQNHGIEDLADNPLTNTATTGVDQTYTVNTVPADTTAPTLTSIERYNPAAATTDTQTLVYEVTFSEDVTEVDAVDFVISQDSTGTGSTTLTGSDNVYYVTVSATQDGTYNLDLVQNHGIEDLADNPLTNTATTGVDQTYTVNTVPADTTAPTLTSIERYNPAAATTDTQTLVYEVTFSEDVTEVDAVDFVISQDSTGTGSTTLTGSDNVYYVTVSATQDGTYNLDLVQNHGIEDLADNPLTDTATTGVDQTYTVNTVPADTTAPTLTSIERYNPAAATTDTQTLVYEVTFSEDVTGVTQSDFVLSSDSTGTAANSVTSISGSGSQYFVTVSASSDGTYNLDLVQNHGIEDLADNPLTDTATTGVDQTYTVNTVPADTTAPTLSSIERYNPATENTDNQTLTYKVIFSEDVTGVDTTDFALSSDSTGGSSSAQFTQTRSPAIAITAANTITDTITVTDSGTVTSVSVAVDVSHTYKGDLKIDLIAPDGTIKTVHNRSGGSADDIDQTYTPDFAGVSIAGIWTLQINDNYATADDGTLNSWTLTINPDSGSSSSSGTSNPVTSISGSGDTYQVTVSATQDGTYNLDLVQNHGIEDSADNPLTDTATTGVDHTYTVNTVPADTTAPTLTSIERYNPAAATTDSQTLVYEVTFSEAVTGVTQSDFVLSSASTGTAANAITSISGSGSQYFVTVSASSDGTYNLDLVQNHGIEDSADNPLTDTATTGVDHTYTVNTVPADTTAPTLTSIERYNPAAATTDSQTLVYEVTFSEAVTGVTQSDFVLSSDSTGGPDPGTGTGQFTQTNSPSTAIAGDQDVVDTISVSNSGNAASVSVDLNITHTYISDLKVDLVAPDGTTKTLHNRSGGSSDDIIATYTPNFNGASISGTWTLQINDDYPSADDGVLNSWTLTINYGDTPDVPNPVTSISGSGSQYFVTVSASSDGTYNLDLVQNHGIEDSADNPLTDTATTGVDHTYTVNTVPADTTAPTLTSIERYNPAVATTDTQTLVYEVTFSEAVTGVTQSDFVLSSASTGTAANAITSISGSGSQYFVTVSASSDGTYNLDLVQNHGIEDSADNPLTDTATTGVDHTYTVNTVPADTTAPTLTSIERYNPAVATTDTQTLVYEVTFSEAVTGVTQSDFVLSSDSTGGPDPGTGTGQFTQTNSPSTAIAGDQDVVDTISVSNSGNAASVSVDLNITHTYISDLKVDLVAPDGTTKTLHNRSGGSSDDIIATYTPNFNGASISGTWTLQINDDYPSADDGVLNSWTLTINYGDTPDVPNPVTSISGSGSQYFVTVSASSDGTYNLDLVQNHGIEDSADNPLTDTATTGVDHTYTVNTVPADTTAPTLTSIERYNPAAATTDSQTLVYEVTFSEAVTGVTQSDFVLSSASTGTAANAITSISGSGSQYFVTVSASSDGTYNLDLVQNHGIEDSADNPLTDTATTGVDHTYTVNTVPADTTAPTLTSIERYNPAVATTDTQTLVYEVTFSEDVTGVDKTDFALSFDSTGGPDPGTGTGQFTQTNSPSTAIAGDQDVVDTISVSNSGNAASVSVDLNITHTYISDLKVDLVAPDGTAKTLHNRSGGSSDDIIATYTPNFNGASISGTWTLQINDDYPSADDGVLNSWTLTINYGDTADVPSPITSISGSGSQYFVTVSASSDGTYNLDLVQNHGIEDSADNPLTDTATTGVDHTYTVNTVPADTTAPTLTSIERYNPVAATTDSQTLVYEVTFSEDVTGVDKIDFALSSDSTGGSSSAQFTQTRSPAIAITAANTITDTITVTGSGTVTSVSVAVDVSHTYKGDLKVDLIAPDGTIKTVHNRSGGSADDIDQTYTPDFAGVPIAGIWTLQINDNYATADDGTLNSWTLTINPGSSSSDTSNPVTSISGSGDTYQVTVLATQDGTYNLDLISSGHDITDKSSNPLTDVTPTTGTDETYTVNTVPADTTAPTLSSIERYNPSTENTDNQTLTYKVIFSEDVTGVDKTDFALSSDSTGGSSSAQFTQTRSPAIAITAANTITDTITVTGSGTVTSVSVAVDVSHTYKGDLKVDLIAPDGTIKTVHNRSGGSADDIDQTYTPDFAGVPIAGIWTLQINDNYATADDGTLNSWTLTINPGSSSSDTSNPVTSISGSGDTYQVTVLATQDGTYNLDLISSGHDITDKSSNPLTDVTPTTGTDETYTVNTVPADTTAPTLSSIERYNPSTENTDNQTLTYKVIFSEDVTGVDKTDFALSSDSTGGSSSAQFTQTRSPAIAITAANTITDTITVTGSGTVTSVSVAVDVSHTYKGDLKVDLIAPDGTIKTVHNRSGGSADDIDQTYTPDFAGVPIAGIWTLQINDNYATADDGTLNSWTLTINPGSSSSDTSNPVTSISGSGDTYQVTVLATQDGTYNLDLISSGHDITDKSSNPLTDVTPTTGTDETYTVNTVPADTTAPTLSSIERYNPSTENTDNQTLTYKVIFSEDVTGVDKTDFALSSDSTGGSSSAQFTQTRSPAIAITAANTITDTITVTGSGTVTSVSVAVDVSHTYKGDLKVDLIAPDGTIKTVHNRSGGSADDIDQTYTPDFAGIPIAGIWTLQINDNYAAADDGTLNSWTLTINPSSSSSDTSNPVTSISGSGNTYYVTVSATQDGTYNLDLVSSGHGIIDTATNPLTNTTPTDADHTYTVSTTG